MADYLLRAPEEDMARWKAVAERLEQPFSRFIRESLDMRLPYSVMMQKLDPPVEAVSPTGAASPSEAASTGDRSSPEPGPVSDPAGSAPVDLRARAVELAERLRERVKADPK